MGSAKRHSPAAPRLAARHSPASEAPESHAEGATPLQHLVQRHLLAKIEEALEPQPPVTLEEAFEPQSPVTIEEAFEPQPPVTLEEALEPQSPVIIEEGIQLLPSATIDIDTASGPSPTANASCNPTQAEAACLSSQTEAAGGPEDRSPAKAESPTEVHLQSQSPAEECVAAEAASPQILTPAPGEAPARTCLRLCSGS